MEKLHCKPGDLAEIIVGQNKVVRVLVLDRDKLVGAILGCPAWRVQLLAPAVTWEKIPRPFGAVGFCADRHIRPIEPLDEDETVEDEQSIPA